MKPSGTRRPPPELLSIALVAALAAVNVYRAWTQSFTSDEAHSYNVLLSDGFARVFTTYEATNHVLQSALSWISCRAFGLSEFALRLPSVLSGFLYLAVVHRLARFLFGTGWTLPVATAALALNPFVLDYLSAARGYGLALGFFFWALDHLARYLASEADSPDWRLHRAGLGLGLSVAANLVFLYPAVALFAVVFALRIRRWRTVVDHLAGPALASAFVLMVIPLSRARRQDFYYGAGTLFDFSDSIVTASLFHNDLARRMWTLLPHMDWTGILSKRVVPALLALIIAGGLWTAARRRKPAPADLALVLVAGTLALALAMLVISHRALGVLYPLGRTGVYWAPLLLLGCMAMAARLRPFVILPAICIAFFAAGFTTGYYSEWLYDADTRDIVQAIPLHRTPVTIGGTWFYEASLNFYRARRGLTWVQPVRREGPDRDYDYYVLAPADHWVIAKRNLRVLYVGPRSGAVLAAPSGTH
jgi:4-amino-4-deoxy-L-arabinose transferase-like glycosyltransferase